MGKKKHEGGHGGAWKVAYADFVTAMMALFMVLWIVSQDAKVIKATSDYFKNPFKPIYQKSSGVINKDPNWKSSSTSAQKATPNSSTPTQVDSAFLQALAKEFYNSMNLEANAAKRPIEVIVTQDGLRVLVYNRSDTRLFAGNTAQLTDWGDFVMQNVSWLSMRYPSNLRIDDYVSTRTVPENSNENYTGWELSTDRANAAQRKLRFYGLENNRILLVVGHVSPTIFPNSDNNNTCERLEISLALTQSG